MVNQRKGKLLATYELELVLGWEGTAREAGGAPASGRIRLPYISEVSRGLRIRGSGFRAL